MRDVVVTKLPGTLNASLNARSAGIPVDLTVPMAGTRSGNVITWTFDESLTPSLDIATGVSLVRIRGRLAMTATLLPPNADPLCDTDLCPYNVRLDSGTGTWAAITLVTAGISHDVRVDGVSARAYGGLPRPRLSNFWLNAPRFPEVAYCSSHEPTYVTGSVATIAPVPAGGSWVQVSSSDDEHVTVAGAFIPQDAQFAPVRLRIAPEWSGSVVLRAAAGGVESQIPLRIGLPDSCSRPWDWLLSTIYSCVECMRVASVNGPGDIVGDLSGKTIFVSRDGKIRGPAAELFGLNNISISSARLNNRGQLWGAAARSGKTVAFIASPPWEGKALPPIFLEDVELAAVNDIGIGVGTRMKGKALQAVLVNAGFVMNLPLKGAAWSRGVGMDDRGQVAGVMSIAGRTRSFVFWKGTVQDLGDLGEGEATATAMSEPGEVTGYAPFKGNMHAFVSSFSGGKWMMKDLGALAGFADLRPTAMNAAGLIVGIASGKSNAVPFLYTPGTGLMDLNKLVAQPGLQLGGAVTINEASQILVNGILNGRKTTLLLEPKARP